MTSDGPATLGLAAALDEVGQRLARRGVRFTPQRRAVAQTVLGSRQPVTAVRIHDEARVLRPELGLMTVYRALDLLAEVGVVRRVHTDQHCEAFVSASRRHGHAVVCTLCGRAVEFTHCHIDTLACAAAAETGFAIDDHFLQFSGVCGDCQLQAGPRHGRPSERREGTRVGRGTC